MSLTRSQSKSETLCRVFFSEGNNDLPKIVVNSAWSSAEIYLHGAHVTHFQKKNEPPVLWMSQLSNFDPKKPIRGGIPIIFPWFGGRKEPMHGFARLQAWELLEMSYVLDGCVQLRLGLPEMAPSATVPAFSAELFVTVGKTLAMELVITNSSKENFVFEDCFHSYFAVSDISAISITGLKGITYIDTCDNRAQKVESEEEIKIAAETDRIYLNTSSTVEILDPKWQRRIRVEKSGSLSTVVWNPWIAKAQRMSDFGDEEYLQMLCVESGNVAENMISLPPGKSSSLRLELSTLGL